MKKRLSALSFATLLCVCSLFAQRAQGEGVYADAYNRGLRCYKSGEWSDAAVLLRQAALSPEYSTDSAWYMIIMSDIYSSDYSAAVNDSDSFLQLFPSSPLRAVVEYQRGKALHGTGDNDVAVLALGSFCNAYPTSGMYPSALFWLAECFFAEYDFEEAKGLYERVVNEFPNSPKAEDAKLKLEMIKIRERERKLLYLLKMMGEEYLSSRENYEREIRKMQTETEADLRKELAEAKKRISELEGRTADTNLKSDTFEVREQKTTAASKTKGASR